jgi:ketosteroid isomerase-like protein
VIWTISGPVDILPFCGQRRGKAIVLKMLARDVPALLEKRRMAPDRMLIDGDNIAVLGKLTAIRRDVRNGISYRIAQFLHFREEKLISYVSIIDSFDAAEQMLGRPLLRHADRLPENGNLVSL